MAGTDDKYIWQLPDTTGLKHEVIMVGGRSAFDSAIRLTGAKLVLAYSPEELANAINENTAMIYTTDLGEKLQRNWRSRKITRFRCCWTMPPAYHPPTTPGSTPGWGLTFTPSRAEKGFAGPVQRLASGPKRLVEAALLNCSPREGAVCRPMKVGKEEVIGCLTALETWLKLDEKKLYAEWNGRVDRIRKLVETVPGVKTDIYIPEDGNRYPTLRVSWDQQAWGFSLVRLRAGVAPERTGHRSRRGGQSKSRDGGSRRQSEPERTKNPDHIELVSMTIQPGQEVIVGQRLRAILGAAQKKSGA